MDEEIEKLGLERKYIRHELHGELLHPTEEGDYPQNVPETVKITVLCRGVTTDIFGSSADSILRTLEKSGIRAPSRCRSGECGFCRTRLVSGTVYIPKSMDMRRKADNRYGYIHPCCTYPLSALVVEIAADNEFHERKE
ncbi:MAG: 2Fe-2S iron-sulfur cluster-binding protein [Hydrogeniiclostridium mannosilyticum]